MKDRKQRNGDQIFLLGKVILARAKKVKIGAETEGAKKKKKRNKNCAKPEVLKLLDHSMAR